MNDYISRQAAIDSIWDGTNYDIYTKEVKEHLEELPTADVRENVRGEWQKVDEQPYFRKHFHKVCCSVCRKQGYDYWNFCPNCGADMRGDKQWTN